MMFPVMKRLGIDVGSYSISSALLVGGAVAASTYEPHRGRVAEKLAALLADYGRRGYDTVGLASSVGARREGALDPVLAAIEGARFLAPGARNALSLGAETFFLAFYGEDGAYRQHSANTPCASGTGSFIEQQAERLGIGCEELARRALAFRGRAPSIATRCAVFAKSDIVHAMQEGYTLDAVAAGLCRGVARNVLDALLKGRALLPPLVLVGGVSRNGKIVMSLRELAGVEALVPEHAAAAGAVGAALLGSARTIDASPLFAPEAKAAALRPRLALELSRYPDFSKYRFAMDGDVEIMDGAAGRARPDRVALGFVVGSTSTKSVAVDPDGEVVRGFYTRTRGAPVEAVRRLLGAMKKSFGGGLPPLEAAGVTGSGRAMIASLFRADLAVNEITAHAAAAVRLSPEVDTIIEIGGQDSKLTLLRSGAVSFSQMNYVCAAGTGSFIEEQATRLGMSLEELADRAFAGRAPLTSDRCTVYMERDLSVLLGEGYSPSALAAAVLYSVRDNYLSKVVQRRPLGRSIVFQGATARNKALVAAFEEALHRPISVSPYCHLTGAYGAALLAVEAFYSKDNTKNTKEDTKSTKEEKEKKGKEEGRRREGKEEKSEAGSSSSFFAGLDGEFVFSTETCALCANRCLLTVAARGGKKTGWGMKCGREYEERRARKERKTEVEKRFEAIGLALDPSTQFIPSLAEGLGVSSAAVDNSRRGVTIALLDGLYQREYNPLWKLFLRRLGFSVSVIEPSQENLLKGKRAVNSDFCAPMIMAHGLAVAASESGACPEPSRGACPERSRGAQTIFFPALVNERTGEAPTRLLFREKIRDAYFCYYSQYLPTILNAVGDGSIGERLISPLVRFDEESDEETAAALHAALAKKFPDLAPAESAAAYSFACDRFRAARAAYRKRLPPPEPGKIRLVLLGRPYAVFDPSISLSLIALLEDMGAEVYWQSEIDAGNGENEPAGRFAGADRFIDRMHWKYGLDVLRALEYAARTDGVFPVYLSCFRCSPDSFLLSYAQEIMQEAGKPFLFLGLDELASIVGYATRVEAAFHSFRNHLMRGGNRMSRNASLDSARGKLQRSEQGDARQDAETFAPGDLVFIPNVSRLIGRFWAACFTAAGFVPEVLDTGPASLNTGYGFVHGGECLPVAAIVGGLVEKLRARNPAPGRAALYLPTLCMACNFPQFPIIARNAAREAGFPGLKVPLVNSMSQGDHLPGGLPLKLFEAGVIASLLYKIYFRLKPYEKKPGAADAALSRAEEVMASAFGGGGEAREAFAGAVAPLRAVETDPAAARRPRLAVLGDFYVKYNETVNQRLQELVMREGGELVIPSFTEMTFHFFDVDARRNPEEARRMKVLRLFESRYEKLAADLIGENGEPDWNNCVREFDARGLGHYLPGETSLNTARALYCLARKSVEAIVHVNPMFCCPGVVSASLFKKISRDFGVPIVDIFYDGTGDPNQVLVPHLHYLSSRAWKGTTKSTKNTKEDETKEIKGNA
jgi:predicted CoA-substrate-specific enzyme activase